MDRQNESRANNEDLRNEQHAEMLETGIGADVFFLVGEEKELIAGHKSVLEEVSPVFKAQFRHGSSNLLASEGSREEPIEVPAVSPTAFRAMFRFIYTRELSGLNKQDIMDVYYAGEKYMIKALTEKCRQLLLFGNYLTVNNTFSVLKHAQRHEDKPLIEHCWKFVEKNTRGLMDSEGFSLLAKDDLCKMFSRKIPRVNELKAVLLETGKCADIHFLVGQGQEKELISAHQFILSDLTNTSRGNLSYWCSLDQLWYPLRRWTNNDKQKGTKQEPIEVTDIHPDAFLAMLQFIYAEDFGRVNKQNVLDVYDAGKKYEIHALVNKCRHLLMDAGQQNFLGKDNVLSVLKHAKRHWDKALIDHCVYFLETKMEADVYFLVGKPGENKELIPAHKFMLSAVSELFDSQFSRWLQEGSKEKPIAVIDIGVDAFRVFLKFIYKEELSGVTKQNVLDVYSAGDKYMISALVGECRQWLLNYQKNVGVDNVLLVLKHAQRHEDKSLIDHCWSFVDRNTTAILKSEEFVVLDQHDLREMFSRNNLISDELCLFESLHRWTVYQSVAAGLKNTAELMRDLIGLFWSNNKWHISDRKLVQATADGLIVTKAIHCRYLMSQNGDYAIVRARQHVSRAIFAILPELKLVYYEVLVKKSEVPCIGWIDRDLPQRTQTQWIGFRGSFSIYIDWVGNLLESGRITEHYCTGFDEGDVVGSGITRDGRIFFTLNGQLNGEPIALENTSQDLMLYPVINLYRKDASVGANFGADPAGKPFKFDINAHKTQLFQ